MITIGEAYLIATSLIYNIAICLLATVCLRSVSLKRALSEKPSFCTITGLAQAKAAGAAQGIAAGAQASVPRSTELATSPAASAVRAAVEALQPDPNQLGDSYSRITGLIGTLVLVCFIWAVGNVVLYNAFEKPEAVKQVLDGVATFILAGSALFAPYAFNQLGKVFGKTADQM